MHCKLKMAWDDVDLVDAAAILHPVSGTRRPAACLALDADSSSAWLSKSTSGGKGEPSASLSKCTLDADAGKLCGIDQQAQ